MFGLGTTELIVILVIVVVLFGAKRLPELGRGVGEGLKNFKKSMSSPDEIDVTPSKDDKPDEKEDEGKNT